MRDPRALARVLFEERVLFAGPPGAGKSTLVRALATAQGRPVLTADPGQPAFGPPGAVSRAVLGAGGWISVRSEGLGTLDAVRFRLPLVVAVARLAAASPGALLVDAPGVHTGPAAELLPALAEACGARTVLWLAPPGDRCPVLADLRAAGLRVVRLDSVAEATPGSHPARVRRRTDAWDRWLAGARLHRLPRAALTLAGLLDAAPGWFGRQAVVLDRAGRTLTLGEVAEARPDAFLVRAPAFAVEAAAGLLVRDAGRDADGLLSTLAPPR